MSGVLCVIALVNAVRNRTGVVSHHHQTGKYDAPETSQLLLPASTILARLFRSVLLEIYGDHYTRELWIPVYMHVRSCRLHLGLPIRDVPRFNGHLASKELRMQYTVQLPIIFAADRVWQVVGIGCRALLPSRRMDCRLPRPLFAVFNEAEKLPFHDLHDIKRSSPLSDTSSVVDSSTGRRRMRSWCSGYKTASASGELEMAGRR
jgi:hypothetical protein